MELQKKLINSLNYDESYKIINQLDEDNLLDKIIPQVKDMKDVGECKYHVVNCFQHSVYALEEFENIIRDKNFFSSHLEGMIDDYLSIRLEENITKKSILKLGIFLHDMGKPACKTIDDNGRVHFKGHELVGAGQAKKLGQELGLSLDAIEILYKYVKYHMTLLGLYKSNNMIKKDLYNLFDELGDEIIGVVILGYVDIVATRKLLNPNEDEGVIKIYMEYVLTNYIYRYKRR